MRKKPKARSLPKKPKQSASVQSKKNYLAKVREIRADNRKKLAEWNREKSQDKKLIEQLRRSNGDRY